MTAEVGIYALFKGKTCVYIGKSHCIMYRIGQHQLEGKKEFDSFAKFPIDFGSIKCPDKEKALKRIETALIRTLCPKYNIQEKIELWDPFCRLRGKEDYTQFIRCRIKQEISAIEWECEQGEDSINYWTEENFRRMHETDVRIMCLCGECAFYQKNVRKNSRLIGRNATRYVERCPLRNTVTYPLTSMDGCTRGLPVRYADVYGEAE